MTMPRSRLTALSMALLLVGACRHPPEEQVTSHDAGAPSASAVSPLPSFAVLPEAGPPDGGRADVRNFCGDIYAADNARLAQKCLSKDVGIAQGMSRAASNLCTDDVNAAVARGRTSFDPDAAKHCIEMLQGAELPRASNADTIFSHYPCDRVLVGNQGVGEPCRFSVECKEGLACVGYAMGVDGTCKKAPKVGELCTVQRFGTILNVQAGELHHPACAPNASCDGTTCKARIAAGQPCVGDTSCVAGLSCVMAKCQKPSGNGGPCYLSADCAFGSWCNKSPSSPSGTCEAKRAGGADCPVPDACRGRCDMPGGADAGAGVVGKCVDVCGSG
jgi:hypothetical protein